MLLILLWQRCVESQRTHSLPATIHAMNSERVSRCCRLSFCCTGNELFGWCCRWCLLWTWYTACVMSPDCIRSGCRYIDQTLSGQLTSLSILCGLSLFLHEAVCRQEWEQEDHIERCVELLPVMQHVLKHCHNRDPLLWPPTVTAAFNSAIKSTPHLASLAILQPSTRNEGKTTSLASAELHAGLPLSMSILAHPGLENG